MISNAATGGGEQNGVFGHWIIFRAKLYDWPIVLEGRCQDYGENIQPITKTVMIYLTTGKKKNQQTTTKNPQR